MVIRDRLLIIEKERSTANLLKTVLKANNYDVLLTDSEAEAITLITSHCPDLIILDLSLPDRGSINVLKYLRTWSLIPVIVLSASSQERDKVEVLDLGADDYITKPFGVSELLARVRAALRHRSQVPDGRLTMQRGILQTGGLMIDYSTHRVFIDGKDAGLTKTEFRIVALLGRYAGRIVTYDVILREIWGPNNNSDNRILRVNMANIRRKTEKNPAEPDYIITEAGVGYYMRIKEHTTDR
ncbi:MAG: response regulator transcription factor [Mogibacterium sp.]|nr:response regulator transcription factor [Mogibacterium sp.]